MSNTENADAESGGGTSHDQIREARNRHQFEQKEAYGMIGDEKVYLVATLTKYGTPKLAAMVGGEWYHYPEEDLDDEFAGGFSKTERKFERVDMLNTSFNGLVEKYDLQEQLPESWKESGS